MDFTALDFETANYNPNSACAIGLVKVRNGGIADAMYSLIKPPTDYFRPDFIEIHGIDSEMVADAPSFIDIWPQIATFIGNDELAAHNFSFDKRVLESIIGYYDLVASSNRWICSLQISRHAWPGLDRYSLDVVAESLGISLNHHDALDDARACALICIAASHAISR